MPKFIINKLGRDKYYDIFKNENIIVKYKILTGLELCHELKNKLIEEANEVKNAESVTEIIIEISDVLEVIDGICKAYNIDKNDLIQAKEKKRKESGGFEIGYFFEHVEMDENNPKIDYFRSSPDKYPEKN